MCGGGGEEVSGNAYQINIIYINITKRGVKRMFLTFKVITNITWKETEVEDYLTHPKSDL